MILALELCTRTAKDVAFLLSSRAELCCRSGKTVMSQNLSPAQHCVLPLHANKRSAPLPRPARAAATESWDLASGSAIERPAQLIPFQIWLSEPEILASLQICSEQQPHCVHMMHSVLWERSRS